MPDFNYANPDDVPVGYITGLGRDYPHPARCHLYLGPFSDPGGPMCSYGWNRDGGTSFSIWRGNMGRKGICKICLRRARAGLEPVPPNGGWQEPEPEPTQEEIDAAWAQFKLEHPDWAPPPRDPSMTPAGPTPGEAPPRPEAAPEPGG